MSNIASDIVDEIDIKPDKTKRLVRIIIAVALSSITMAFFIGKFIMNQINEGEKVKENSQKITQLDNKLNQNTDNLNARIDQVYTDGYDVFNSFHEYNKNELELIIDYGMTDRELLKKMLNINYSERQNVFKTKIENAKKNNSNISQNNGLRQTIKIISNNDTTYHIKNATKNYIDNIDTTVYRINEIIQNEENSWLYDVKYQKI